MRQAGVIAAAGLYALDHQVERLAQDHRRARQLAEGIAALPGLSIDLALVQTNLVYFDLAPDHGSAAERGARRIALVQRLREHGVLVSGGVGRLRAVTHLDVDDSGIERTLHVLKELTRG